MDFCSLRRQGKKHHHILGRGHAQFLEYNLPQRLSRYLEMITTPPTVILNRNAGVPKCIEVRIKRPSANFISTREADAHFIAASQKGTDQQDRGANPRRQLTVKFYRINLVIYDLNGMFIEPALARAHLPQNLEHY